MRILRARVEGHINKNSSGQEYQTADLVRRPCFQEWRAYDEDLSALL